MRALILAVLLALAWPCFPVCAQTAKPAAAATDIAALEKTALAAMEIKDWPLALSLWDRYEFVNLDLLTLSACETAVGGGKDANGREVEGFGALAQNQGAKGVIATLWPVADESTGQFMQLFYGFRQKHPGITKAEAMQMAQAAFIERRVAPALAEVSRGLTRTGAGPAAAATTDHPYYWAPFILMGNWL